MNRQRDAATAIVYATISANVDHGVALERAAAERLDHVTMNAAGREASSLDQSIW